MDEEQWSFPIVQGMGGGLWVIYLLLYGFGKAHRLYKDPAGAS